MGSAAKIFQSIGASFNLNLGKYSISVAFWQVGAIVFLIFLLILMMAQFRRHNIDWSFKGAVFGVFFGFLLALTLEGFLIIGGKTVLTEVLGWKNAPAPLQLALDSGKTELIKVLGIETQIPSAKAAAGSPLQSTLESVQSLNPGDLKLVKNLICKP